MNDRFTPDEAAVIRQAWAAIKPVIAAAAAALAPTQDEFVLVPNDVAAAAVIPARRALAACLDGDDDQAAELLAGLDDTQLYAIEGAASGLAIHASRHRKRLAAHVETSGDTCLRRTRNIPHIPHRWTYKDAEYSCPGEMLGASVTLEAVDEIAAALAPWKRDLLTAQAAEGEQDEPARVMSRADLAAELRTVREALDAAGIVIASLRNQRDEQRQRAARANVQATALLRRAETAERQATEHKARAQRAEADAADWRATAHGYEAAVERARQAAADLRTEDLGGDVNAGLSEAAHRIDKALDGPDSATANP